MPPQAQFDPNAGYQPSSGVVASFDPNASYQPATAQPSFATRNVTSGGFWDTLQREYDAANQSIAGMPAAVYHAFADPPTQEEKDKFGGEAEVSGAKRVGLGVHRLATAPAEVAADWYSDALRDKIPDAYEQALSVAPEAVGSAAGNAVLGKGIEMGVDAAPGVVASARNIPAVAKSALATTGKAATAAGDLVDPDLAGLVSPRLAHALRLAKKVGKVATKYGTEAAPEAEATGAPIERDATRQNVPFAGEEEEPAAASPRTASPAETNPTPAETKAPASETKITPAAVESQVNDALGNQAQRQAREQLGPTATLKQISDRAQQIKAAANTKTSGASASAIPEGFTPTDSSVLRAYKYNPKAREFESITNSGQHYVHGDVSPEQAQAFEAADSKGKTWNQLRSQSPLVAKVLNGERVAVNPASMIESGDDVIPKSEAGMQRTVVTDPATGRPEFSDVLAAKTATGSGSATSGGEDLTPLLQQSLDNAKAAKAAQPPLRPSSGGQTPQYIYRVRNLGETGLSPRASSHAEATTSLDQARAMLAGRESVEGVPQELVKIDTTKLDPKQYEFRAFGNDKRGPDWIKFKSDVPEDAISPVDAPVQK